MRRCEEYGAGESVTGLALVQAGIDASAQVKVLQPVEHEQGALDPAQFAQSGGKPVLARIAAECILSRSSGPVAYNQCVGHYLAELQQSPSFTVNNNPSPRNTTQPALPSVPPPSMAPSVAPALPALPYPASMFAENGSCYGDISNIAGYLRPLTSTATLGRMEHMFADITEVIANT